MAYAIRRSAREARSSQRYPTQFGGQVVDQTGVFPVTVANISVDGAMIRSTTTLRVGSRVALMANGLEVPATVMWKDDGEYGLRLLRSINPLEIVRLNYAGLEHLRSARMMADARR